VDTGKNLPILEMEADKEIMKRLPEKSLELVRVFSRSKQNLNKYFFFDQAA
jgi:hypothetical protein